MSSEATTTGIGFPGVQRVEMIDETNGYVLVRLKPWTVYRPGFDEYASYTESKTYTNAAFDELGLKLSRTASSISRGSYDATRDIWTYPPTTT